MSPPDRVAYESQSLPAYPTLPGAVAPPAPPRCHGTGRVSLSAKSPSTPDRDNCQFGHRRPRHARRYGACQGSCLDGVPTPVILCIAPRCGHRKATGHKTQGLRVLYGRTVEASGIGPYAPGSLPARPPRPTRTCGPPDPMVSATQEGATSVEQLMTRPRSSLDAARTGPPW